LTPGISERVQQLRRTRTPFVHATVVRAQHPTSAHAGDEAILLADGTIEGFVGGQCTQNSVRTAALGALRGGESVLLRVLPDGEAHFPDAPGAAVVVNPCLSGGALEIFLEPEVPAPLVCVYGQTPVTEALAKLCAGVGYEVRDDLEFTGATAVVIGSLGGPEGEIIRAAIDAGVGYVGLVASRPRGAAVIDAVGLSAQQRSRVHSPVGLAIGARTASEIAVSILAELISEIRLGGLAVHAPPSAAPTEAVDPVCGMSVVVGASTPHVTYEDRDHWFCGDGCRASFLAARFGREER
jgi:xanthine dehydrogenase accessory factor